jgi:transcriptional regulator of acetoin/glycerol metabolism
VEGEEEGDKGGSAVQLADPQRPRPSAQADNAGLLEFPAEEPFYLSIGQEVTIFEAAYQRRLPVMLKGPTGCGKTRFIRYMAWRLHRPLVTVACHDDLSANDLTGRFLVRGGETVWQDGPLTAAARAGAICYLDEVVEARLQGSICSASPSIARARSTCRRCSVHTAMPCSGIFVNYLNVFPRSTAF